MPRFAILEHDWPTRHWDLLLEDGDVLLAWRLLDEPRLGATVPAERNADHRTMYLDYEGPVAGDRGTVTRWDGGTFEWIARPTEVRMMGTKIVGRLRWVPADGGWSCTIVEPRGGVCEAERGAV